MPKTKKKEKDPNRPKRPLTAFMRYSSKRRSKIRLEDPTKSMIQISKIIGEEWRNLSANDKRPFHDAATKDHEEYRVAKEKYDASKPKRPRTSYALFMKTNRAYIAKKNPNVSPRELMKFIAAEWKALNSVEKEKYEKMAIEDRERWEKNKNESKV